MAFAPTSFPSGGTLLASTMKANDDALRQYLHEGIVTGDMQSSPAWVNTRHVSPPVIDPIRNMQHGVTGHLGGRVFEPGRWYTMTGASFTRRGRSEDNAIWAEVPNTALTINLRGASTMVLHYHITAYVGPENPASDNRRVTIAPYARPAASPFHDSQVYEHGGLPIRQNVGHSTTGAAATFRSLGGPELPYNVSGYGQRSGQMLFTTSAIDGEFHVGLAHWSITPVALITSWAVCLEGYY